MDEIQKLKRQLRKCREKALIQRRERGDWQLRALNAECERNALKRCLQPFADAVTGTEEVHGLLKRLPDGRFSFTNEQTYGIRTRPMLHDWLNAVRTLNPNWDNRHKT